jgi:hypothetical protein
MIAGRLWVGFVGAFVGCGGAGHDGSHSSSNGAAGDTGRVGSGGAAATGGSTATGGSAGTDATATGGSGVSDIAVDCGKAGPNCFSVSGTLRGATPFALSCSGESASASRLLGNAPAWWVTCRKPDGVTVEFQVPVQEPGAVAYAYAATSPIQAFCLTLPGVQGAETQASPRSKNFVAASAAGSVVEREDGLTLLTVTGQGTWAAPAETCANTLERVDCLEAQLEVSVNVVAP